MSTHAAPRAAARADFRSGAPASPHGAAGRRRTDSFDGLRRASDRLDRLLQDASTDARSQREHERRVGEAEAIAEAIRSAFRRPSAGQPVNPPLWQDDGKAIW